MVKLHWRQTTFSSHTRCICMLLLSLVLLHMPQYVRSRPLDMVRTTHLATATQISPQLTEVTPHNQRSTLATITELLEEDAQRAKAPDQPPIPPRPELVIKGRSPLLFTCPDGRKGLHMVHIRLLLGQTEARGSLGTFRAGRLLLFRDFSLPGLARATSQSFLLYVSYDLNQDFPFLEASYDVLRMRMTEGASVLYLPEKAWSYTIKAHLQIAFPRVAELIVQHGLATQEEMDSVDMYITSRIDNDDAVHTDAIRLTQEEACSYLGPDPANNVFISYIEPKRFWLPDPRHPYGQLAFVRSQGVPIEEIRHQKHILKFKPILQSLGVDKTLMFCSTPLNCYTHQHFEPAFINHARNTTDCPFLWNKDTTLRILRPKDGAVGALYSRTPGSWYNEINDRGYHFLDMNTDALEGCGIDTGELAATNMLLGMLYKEAPDAAKLSASAAKGFGGIGSMFTKQAAQYRAKLAAPTTPIPAN